MFKIIVTRTDYITDCRTHKTDPRRFKTRKNAEKAAQRIGYICSPDGKTKTMELSADVVEVSYE